MVTVERLIAEAEDVRAAAMENGQLSAAVSAITAKAKLAGLWLADSACGRWRVFRPIAVPFTRFSSDAAGGFFGIGRTSSSWIAGGFRSDALGRWDMRVIILPNAALN